MKVRDLLIVGAFVLGGVAVAYWGDALKALQSWQYTSPLCIRVEEAIADLNGATRSKLKAELEKQAALRQALELSIQEVGEADQHIAKLADALAHSERVRDTQEQQLAHQQQLIGSHEAVARETNYRYQALVARIRELGRDDAIAGLVKE